ncbi:MAG: hypothetical protein HQK51_06845 [Oligoflexia bacterium]|nr:hypothetical protein [Oligoflexia bacterium]
MSKNLMVTENFQWILRLLIFIFILLSCLSPLALFCCERIPNGNISLFATYNYKDGNENIPGQYNHYGKYKKINLTGCKPADAQKFILIQVAPVYKNFIDQSFGSAYGKINDLCNIENSPLSSSNMTNSGFDNFFKKASELLRTCLEVKVTNQNGKLVFPEQQFDCAVTRLNDKEAILKGGHCYVQIGSFPSLQYEFQIAKNCLSRDFLAENKIEPQDVKTQFSFFVSADASGTSIDLNYIGVLDGNVVISPGKDLLPIQDYLKDVPIWPTLAIPQIEVGKIELKTLPDPITHLPRYHLFLPLFADNHCQKVCVRELCTSPCNFRFPVIGEVLLYHKSSRSSSRGNRSGRFVNIDSWFQGGIAVPGNISYFSSNHEIKEELKKGDKLIIEINFESPELSLKSFLKQEKNNLIRRAEITFSRSTDGIGSLGELGMLPGLRLSDMGELPELPPVSGAGITIGSEEEKFRSAFSVMKNLLSELRDWPPQYLKVCKNKNVCFDAQKRFLQIKFGLSIADIKEDGEVIFGDVVKIKNSTIAENYEGKVTKWPELKCNN